MMSGKLKILVLVMLLSISLSGCCHYCRPKDLFSFIDRHCFVADWMNDHSCTSCQCRGNNCPPPIRVSHPDLSLSNPVPAHDNASN